MAACEAKMTAACSVVWSKAPVVLAYRLRPPMVEPCRKISIPICDSTPSSTARGANRGHRCSVRMSRTTAAC